MDEGWHFGCNDNTALGWGITLAYFASATLCLLTARRSPNTARNAGHTWLLIGTGLILLGFNKQLDLQNWLRFAGRDLSQSLGLYQLKSAIRIAFLVLLAAIGLAAALRWHHRFLATILGKPCLLAGLGLLALFIVRSGLPPLPRTRWEFLLVTRPGCLWTLELGALVLIAISAAATLASQTRRSPGTG